MSENNVARVVQEGDRLYFVSKSSPADAPLDSHCNINHNLNNTNVNIVSISLNDNQHMMPSIDEASLPNLKDLLLPHVSTAASNALGV